MSEFFALNGYGAYVWPSYLVTLLVLGAAILLCVRGHARALADLRRLEEEKR
jgi:heme exporter protein CcmD